MELIVVIVILATIAGVVIANLDGVEGKARDDLNAHELMELRRAIQQFTADTGHLPRTGLFAPGGSQLTWPTTIDPVTDPVLASTWLSHPANMWQLYHCPVSGHPLATWNPDTRRGWRGPYLSRAGEGRVIVGDSFAGNTELPLMPAVADPHPATPLDGTNQFKWYPWDSDVSSFPRHGRPYYLLVPSSGHPRTDAKIIGFGLDGVYSGGAADSDDVTVHVFQ